MGIRNMMNIFLIVIFCSIIVIGVLSQLKDSRGKWGERIIRCILRFLPRQYKVFNDARIYSKSRKCQIDHLVVSPYGIFVIETKSYLGLTYGNSQDCMLHRSVLGKKYQTGNPLLQNQYHIDLLKHKLRSIKGFDDSWLHSVVVFGFGSIVRFNDKPSNVKMFCGLYRYIRKFKTALISDSKIIDIVEEIKSRK